MIACMYTTTTTLPSVQAQFATMSSQQQHFSMKRVYIFSGKCQVLHHSGFVPSYKQQKRYFISRLYLFRQLRRCNATHSACFLSCDNKILITLKTNKSGVQTKSTFQTRLEYFSDSSRYYVYVFLLLFLLLF